MLCRNHLPVCPLAFCPHPYWGERCRCCSVIRCIQRRSSSEAVSLSVCSAALSLIISRLESRLCRREYPIIGFRKLPAFMYYCGWWYKIKKLLKHIIISNVLNQSRQVVLEELRIRVREKWFLRNIRIRGYPLCKRLRRFRNPRILCQNLYDFGILGFHRLHNLKGRSAEVKPGRLALNPLYHPWQIASLLLEQGCCSVW